MEEKDLLEKDPIEQNNKENKQNNHITIEELENQIKSDKFQSKEELFEKLVELRNNGMINIIDNQKMRELLDLYDQTHKKLEPPLDTQNYASATVENTNLIVSKQNDRILQTTKDTETFEEEFKQEQNELSVQSENGITNAEEVFRSMANKKIEMNLITLEEAITGTNLTVEDLNKIRFFITCGYVNPHSVRVDISKGVLYNIETSDIYEIKYNQDTQEFEIYKNNALEYTEHELKEELARQKEKDKPKTKILKKENTPYLNNSAFTKISFLILNAISIALLITMVILLNK